MHINHHCTKSWSPGNTAGPGLTAAGSTYIWQTNALTVEINISSGKTGIDTSDSLNPMNPMTLDHPTTNLSYPQRQWSNLHGASLLHPPMLSRPHHLVRRLTSSLAGHRGDLCSLSFGGKKWFLTHSAVQANLKLTRICLPFFLLSTGIKGVCHHHLECPMSLLECDFSFYSEQHSPWLWAIRV